MIAPIPGSPDDHAVAEFAPFACGLGACAMSVRTGIVVSRIERKGDS